MVRITLLAWVMSLFALTISALPMGMNNSMAYTATNATNLSKIMVHGNVSSEIKETKHTIIQINVPAPVWIKGGQVYGWNAPYDKNTYYIHDIDDYWRSDLNGSQAVHDLFYQLVDKLDTRLRNIFWGKERNCDKYFVIILTENMPKKHHIIEEAIKAAGGPDIKKIKHTTLRDPAEDLVRHKNLDFWMLAQAYPRPFAFAKKLIDAGVDTSKLYGPGFVAR